MRAASLLLALPVMACSTVAGAQPPAWSVRAGWEYTSLGDAQPDGFGVTGGHTGRLSVERTILRPISGVVDVRMWGLEQPGPRTVGVEADLGAVVAYDLHVRRLLDRPLRIGVTVSIGGYRVPLATAIGSLRFLGVRPAVGAFVSYMWDKGTMVRIGADVRRYDTLVWSGWSWTGCVSGGWGF